MRDAFLWSGGTVSLDEGTFENQFNFHLDGSGAAGAHVIIDITGYYVPA